MSKPARSILQNAANDEFNIKELSSRYEGFDEEHMLLAGETAWLAYKSLTNFIEPWTRTGSTTEVHYLDKDFLTENFAGILVIRTMELQDAPDLDIVGRSEY